MSSTAFAAAAENATRAADAYWAMQKAFYQPTTRFYREFYKYDPAQDQPIGYVWSFEEATRRRCTCTACQAQRGRTLAQFRTV
jgi:hypothetical protein